MILSANQQRWCAAQGLGVGYDDDDPALHQFRHLVEPTGERRERTAWEPGEDPTYEVEAALCRSPRLWFGRARGHVWPWLETEATWAFPDEPLTDKVRRERSVYWASIDCPGCLWIATERGLPAE